MIVYGPSSAWRDPIVRLAEGAPLYVAHPLTVFLKDEAEGPRAARLALFSLCESVEALVRFLAIARSVEIIGDSETEKAPRWLARAAADNLVTPTFGKWMNLLRVISHERQRPSRLLPELVAAAAAFDAEFFPQPANSQHKERSNLFYVRNPIAHGSGISDAYARDLLALWGPKIAAVLEGLDWLRQIELWVRDPNGFRCMNGPDAEGSCVEPPA
jgi:hypothetical protein